MSANSLFPTVIMALLLLAPLLVGIVLFVRGWRGGTALTEPSCAKCGYDLRGFAGTPPTVCAECGSDLRGARAVRWGKTERRPRLMRAGAALAVIPLLVAAALGTREAMRLGPGQAPRSTKALLASLQANAGQPWDWQEVERRQAAGQLRPEETAQAVDHLIAHLAASPTPGQQPLQWSQRFIEPLDQAGGIPDEQYARLAKAFYGSAPVVRVSPSVRQGAALPFLVDFSGSWNLPGAEMVKALRAVKLADGRDLPLRHAHDPAPPGAKPDPDLLSSSGPFGIDARADLAGLPPGEHTLTFVMEAGVLKAGTQPQIVHSSPGQPRHWPRGRARWTMSVPVKVTIIPPDQSPIALVTDPALDPQKSGAMKVKRAGVIRTGMGPRLTLELEVSRLPLPVSFDVVAKVAGQDLALGRYGATPEGQGWMTGLTHTFEALPPEVRAIDVTLRPNPAAAEARPGVGRIWGGVIEFRSVPLQRHDLDTGDGPAPAGR